MNKLKSKIKLRNSCSGNYWDIVLVTNDSNRALLVCGYSYNEKRNAVNAATRISTKTGIPYDPEIIKQHGC